MLSLPFKIATYSLKYFGVNISRDPKDIYKLNFLPMLENLKKKQYKLLADPTTFIDECYQDGDITQILVSFLEFTH